MRFLLECSECGKTSEVSRLSRVDGRLVATCGACGRHVPTPEEGGGASETDPPAFPTPSRIVAPPRREVTAAAQETAPNGDVPAEDPPDKDACPKCGLTRTPERESCPRCGLVFALWVAPEAPFTAHPDLMARWAELADVPPEDPGHDRFLEACFRAGALSDAARAYKGLTAGGRPEPAARIRQIQLLSQMQFTPSAPLERRGLRWIPWALVFLVLLAALYLWTITPDDLLR